MIVFYFLCVSGRGEEGSKRPGYLCTWVWRLRAPPVSQITPSLILSAWDPVISSGHT